MVLQLYNEDERRRGSSGAMVASLLTPPLARSYICDGPYTHTRSHVDSVISGDEKSFNGTLSWVAWVWDIQFPCSLAGWQFGGWDDVKRVLNGK